MKYLVMECHAGYAVLMDEASRFVRAANLHYEVGQTVTDPILMQEDAQPQIRVTHKGAIRIAAAAACLLLMSAAGFGYYRSSRTKSVVVVVEQKRYELKLNRSGEVMTVQHHSKNGEEIVENLGGQHQTAAAVVNSLLKDSLDQGQISGGDTVQIYLAAENAKSYETYKSEIETEAAKLQLNADVQGLDAAPEPPEPPAHENGTKPAPEKETRKPDPKKDPPPAPADPSAPANGKEVQEHTPPAPPAHDEKPTPPAHDNAPAAPVTESDALTPADPPQPPAAAEPPQPVQEKEGKQEKQEKHEEHEHPEPAAPGDQEADKPVTPPEPVHPHLPKQENLPDAGPAAPRPAGIPAPETPVSEADDPAELIPAAHLLPR
ncbi:MAG TPA: hypothetical protein DDX71_04975 [Ruminococcus sp.]|nr:hypothetical protein [Ruminococcus sp.]